MKLLQNLEPLTEGRISLPKNDLEEYKIRDSEKYSVECDYKNARFRLTCIIDNAQINDDSSNCILIILNAVACSN